jgi:Trypsin-like peptidase domain/MAP3K TRAFs-binding domain
MPLLPAEDRSVWPDASGVVDSIIEALDRFDWPEVERLCRTGAPERPSLLQRLESAIAPFPAEEASELLRGLRSKRRFELMGILADAFLRAGPTEAEIQRQYSQAMIDQGNLTAAEGELNRILLNHNAPRREQDEANGLLGRIYKQLYVNARQPTNPRQQRNMAQAIEYYWRAYAGNRGRNIWQGINVVALLARARRDQIAMRYSEVPGELPLVNEIQGVLEQKKDAEGTLEYWDRAIAMETAVARWDFACAQDSKQAGQFAVEAVGWLRLYLRDARVSAFECASTLRQLREVWELAADNSPGDVLINGLQAAMLKHEGGLVELKATEVQQSLEKNFSGEGDLPLLWWQTGLQRCRAVARVDSAAGKAIGTGFLVNGPDFLDDVGPEPVLLTNWHVISKDAEHPLSIAPEGATAFFEGCGKRYSVSKLLGFSRKLDATFVALEPIDPDLGRCPLKPPPAAFDATKRQRLYIIGHPGGRGLSFSLHDSIWLDTDGTLVHYRTPTEGGNSGSPVFDQENWTLVALHHAGTSKMGRLKNQPGTYEANEGVAISAIQGAVRANRMS